MLLYTWEFDKITLKYEGYPEPSSCAKIAWVKNRIFKSKRYDLMDELSKYPKVFIFWKCLRKSIADETF